MSLGSALCGFMNMIPGFKGPPVFTGAEAELQATTATHLAFTVYAAYVSMETS